MTIKLIQAPTEADAPLLDAMYRGRAVAFSERLGWDVVVKDGCERDSFDDCNPLYLISVHPKTGEYQGSVRLLPTTGPNMLRDVFPQLLDAYCAHCEDVVPNTIESATIWESSRICSAGNKKAVLAELILGIGEVSIAAGLTQIVSVFDARMYRLLSKIVKLDVIGTPQTIGDCMCYAALFDADAAAVEYVRKQTGIKESVLA